MDAATPDDERIEKLVGRLGGRARSEREGGGRDGESTEQHVFSKSSVGAKRST